MTSMLSIPVEKFMRLPVLQADLTGKHVIVSGGNSGLGAEAVKHYAKQEKPAASITILCRNVANGEKVAKEAKEASDYKGDIVVEKVDLLDFASIKAFTSKWNASGKPADVVLMNAGVVMTKFELSVDGNERTLQVNVLAPILIILLLRPALEKSTAARVTIVSSILSQYALGKSPTFSNKEQSYIDVCNSKKGPNLVTFYNDSKLLVVMLGRQLAKRFPKNVTVTEVDPGYCMSSLDQNFPAFVRPIALGFRWLLGRTTELGSRNLVWATLAGEKEGIDGKGTYIANCRLTRPNTLLAKPEGEEIEERMYKQTIDYLAKVAPEATQGL